MNYTQARERFNVISNLVFAVNELGGRVNLSVSGSTNLVSAYQFPEEGDGICVGTYFSDFDSAEDYAIDLILKLSTMLVELRANSEGLV